MPKTIPVDDEIVNRFHAAPTSRTIATIVGAVGAVVLWSTMYAQVYADDRAATLCEDDAHVSTVDGCEAGERNLAKHQPELAEDYVLAPD